LIGLTALAVLAGTAIRFWPHGDLWLDEALSLNIARLPISKIPEALRQDGHPPLYYVLLHFWSMLGPTNTWARALSGVVTLIGMPLAYLSGYSVGQRAHADHLGARRTGLITLAVFSSIPFLVRYGSETRMYALVAVQVFGAYLLVDALWSGKSSGRGRLLNTAGLAALTGAALWTHYWAMWLAAAVGIVALWRSIKDPNTERRIGARYSVAGLIVGGITFIPWVPSLLYQGAHTGTPWGTVFRPATMLVVTIIDIAGGAFAEAQGLSYLLVGLVASALVVRVARGAASSGGGSGSATEHLELGFVPLARVRTEMLIFTITMAIAWAVSFASGTTYASRYAAVVVPFFIIAVSAGISLARTPRATSALLAVFLAGSVLSGVVEITSDRSQSGMVTEAVISDTKRNPSTIAPLVVVCPDQLGPAVGRAFERRTGPSGSPQVVPFPTAGDARLVDWVDYAQRNKAANGAEFIEQLNKKFGSARTVYLIANNSYRTFEGKCEQVAGALGAGRRSELLVKGNGERFFEGMNLTVFRPSP